MSHKMPHSLVMSDEDHQELRRTLFTEDGCENFAVVFCGVAEGQFGCRLLVREILVAPKGAYRERLENHLEIAPSFINSLTLRSW